MQNNSDHVQNQSFDMVPIQKTLEKNESELPKQTSKKIDNKEIIQIGRKNQKLEEKIILQDQK